MVITNVLGLLTYRLKLPDQWKIHPVFHTTLLTPYRENDIHGPNYTYLALEIIGDNDEWEVEAIIGHRQKYGKMTYQVKWKGYPTLENSWEPEAHLGNTSELLEEYKSTHCLLQALILRTCSTTAL